MRWIVRLAVALVVLAVAFIGAIFAASELGGEVVVLHTHDEGKDRVTHLWVVDDAGFAWLRAGEPGSGWLQRLEADPDVVVERGGVSIPFHAVPVRDAAVRDRIHALMRAKYPWADRFISLLRDPNGSVPVRLEPVRHDD